MVISCIAYGLVPSSTSVPFDEEIQIGTPLNVIPEKSIPDILSPIIDSTSSIGQSSKICNSCGENKSLAKFKTNGGKPDGTKYRMATCRECMEKKKFNKKFQGSIISDGSCVDPKFSTPTKKDRLYETDEIKIRKLQAIDKAVKVISEI